MTVPDGSGPAERPAARVGVPPIAPDDTVRVVLRTTWHLPPDGCTRLPGGTTSATWTVRTDDRRYVAKLVPATAQPAFEAGLRIAERLCAAGVDAGGPVRTATGALCVPVGDGVLALLAYVPGRPLDPADPVDQHWWGERLAAAHRHLVDVRLAGLTPWSRVRPPQPSEASRALDSLQGTDRLTFGGLHGEANPDAFLLDRDTGRIGIVGWGSACFGPLVYDVACAVHHAGGIAHATEFLDAYAAAAPLARAELESALPVLMGFRAAVLTARPLSL